MAENLTNDQGKSDDLDLVTLLRNTIGFVKNYGNIIFLFALVGLLAGAMAFMAMPKLYESKLIVHASILTNAEQIAIIDDWKDFLRKGETQALATILNTDPAILSKVADIQATEIQKIPGPNPNGFAIEVLVKDTSILDSLQTGIIYGLENNAYVKPRLELKKYELKQMIQSVANEIQKLDSTQYLFEKGASLKGGPGNNGFIIDISDVNTQMITLNEKSLALQRELKFVSPIQVMQKFLKFKNPVKPKLFVLLVSGLFGGIFIGSVIAVIMYLRKKLS